MAGDFDCTVPLENGWDEHLAKMIGELRPDAYDRVTARGQHLMIMRREERRRQREERA